MELCSEVSVEEDSESEADGRAVLCLHIWSMVRVELNCRPGGRSCRRSADSDMRRRWNYVSVIHGMDVTWLVTPLINE